MGRTSRVWPREGSYNLAMVVKNITNGFVSRCLMGILLLATLLPSQYVSAQSVLVRAVLFFSPTCPHCQLVIEDELPAIFDAYGGQPQLKIIPSVPDEERFRYLLTNSVLQILLIDTYKPDGAALYNSATEAFQIPAERSGVPRLIIGDRVLLGSIEIPMELPGLIEEGIAQGGLDWPEIPGLADLLAPMIEPTAPPPSATPEASEAPIRPAVTSSTDGNPTGVPAPDAIEAMRGDWLDRVRLDPTGNGIAIVVLLAMLLSLLGVGVVVRERHRYAVPDAVVFALLAVNFLIAAYLTFVESTGTEAVCGPVGDCNAVQQSSYAMLFGVLPIGALGMLGYVAILVARLLSRSRSPQTADRARLAELVMTAGGTVFSVYLTFLEPFVIGATCSWCLGSAVIMTALMWLAAGNLPD